MPWSPGTPAPVALNGAIAATVSGKIYVFGGEGSNPRVQAQVYDPVLDTWTGLTPSPVDLDWLSSACVIGGKVYIVTWGAAHLYLYDPATDAWTTTLSQPPARFGGGSLFTAATDGTNLYAVQGYTPTSTGRIIVYNPTADTWTTPYPNLTTTQFPQGFASGFSLVKGGKLYLANGWDNGTAPDGITAALDLTAGTWTVLATNSVHLEDFPPTIDGAPNPILIGGDSDTVTDSTAVRLYDLLANAWSAGPSLANSRTAACAAIVGSTLYVIGGTHGSGPSVAMTSVEKIPVSELTTGQTTPSVPVGPGFEVNAEDQILTAVLSLSGAAVTPPAGWQPIPTLTYVYPSPVIVNGQPTDGAGGPWAFTTEARGVWAFFDIVVGGKNVTTFRTFADGTTPIQTIVERWTDKDPGGDDQLDLWFPGITSYDHIGVGVLSWLYPGSIVTVRKRTVGPTVVLTDIFQGTVGPIDDTITGPSDGAVASTVTIHCEGIWTRLDDFICLPRTSTAPIDSGDWIRSQVNRAQTYGWPAQRMPRKVTGIKTVESGSYGAKIATDTVMQALALMQDSSHIWTVGVQRPRRLVIRDRKQMTDAAAFSLVCGQRGVTHTLTLDPTTAKNAIYGHGQAPFGPVDPATGEQPALADWMNWKYPVAYINPPVYPLPSGSVCCTNLFCAGCSTTGFQPFSDELRAQGWGTVVSGNTYLSADLDEIRAYQQQHGIAIDGIVGPQTWNTAFQVGQNSKALTDAYIRELVSGHAQQPYIVNARGAILALNPAFDPTHAPRREMLEQFGPISKAVATKSARLEWTRIRNPYYLGTITATNVDPPEMCALDTVSNSIMTFRSHAGVNRKLFVAQVERVPGLNRATSPDRRVTWTVSEQPDDIMTLVQRIQRDRGIKDVLYSNRPPRHLAKAIPNWPIFDAESGAGIQQPESQFAGLWNKYLIPMGTHLDVAAVRIVADTPCKMAAAIFANPNLTVAAMVGGSSSGLANPVTGASGGQDPWAVNQKRLIKQGIMWSTGNPTAMQGYWPNDPGSGSLTGVLADTSQWPYRSSAGVFASLFVWTSVSCKVSGDPAFGYRVIYPTPIGG